MRRTKPILTLLSSILKITFSILGTVLCLPFIIFTVAALFGKMGGDVLGAYIILVVYLVHVLFNYWYIVLVGTALILFLKFKKEKSYDLCSRAGPIFAVAIIAVSAFSLGYYNSKAFVLNSLDKKSWKAEIQANQFWGEEKQKQISNCTSSGYVGHGA